MRKRSLSHVAEGVQQIGTRWQGSGTLWREQKSMAPIHTIYDSLNSQVATSSCIMYNYIAEL